jgi:hypothetical protein
MDLIKLVLHRILVVPDDSLFPAESGPHVSLWVELHR